VRTTLRTLLGTGASNQTEFSIADMERLALSVQGTSKVTISLSHSPPFYSAITVAGQGLYSILPGARWLKVERGGSGTTVLLNWSY
jgi:hypothetical protein